MIAVVFIYYSAWKSTFLKFHRRQLLSSPHCLHLVLKYQSSRQLFRLLSECSVYRLPPPPSIVKPIRLASLAQAFLKFRAFHFQSTFPSVAMLLLTCVNPFRFVSTSSSRAYENVSKKQ